MMIYHILYNVLYVYLSLHNAIKCCISIKYKFFFTNVRIDGIIQAQTHHAACRKIHDSSVNDAATGMQYIVDPPQDLDTLLTPHSVQKEHIKKEL
jgi:hypothetical protein